MKRQIRNIFAESALILSIPLLFLSLNSHASIAEIRLSSIIGAINLFDETFKRLDLQCGTATAISEDYASEIDTLVKEKTGISYKRFVELFGDSAYTSETVTEVLSNFESCDSSVIRLWHSRVSKELQRNVNKLRDTEEVELQVNEPLEGPVNRSADTPNLSSEIKVADSVELTGSVRLNIEGSDGELMLGKFMNSSSEFDSARSCSLEFSADDEFYNSYPGTYQMALYGDSVSYAFVISSKYIDENSRYWNIPIRDVSLTVTDNVIDDSQWDQGDIDGRYSLLAFDSKLGLKIFNALTMGEPAVISLRRDTSPKSVTITTQPLTAKQASIAKKCIKLVQGDL